MPQQHQIEPRPALARAVRRWIDCGYYDRRDVVATILDSAGVERLIDEVFPVADVCRDDEVERALWDERNEGDRFE